jgi:hypothetical protein
MRHLISLLTGGAALVVGANLVFPTLSTSTAQTQSPLELQTAEQTVLIIKNVGDDEITIQDIAINKRPECTDDTDLIKTNIGADESDIQNAKMYFNYPISTPGMTPVERAQKDQQELTLFQSLLQQHAGHQAWVSWPPDGSVNLDAALMADQTDEKRKSPDDLSLPKLASGESLVRNATCQGSSIVRVDISTDKGAWSWTFN